jgi:ATP-dependent Clp endopeptidase proteolytic subunit ClpP
LQRIAYTVHICAMKQFKNISELDDQTCKILLYGVIGEDEGFISSAYFVGMLDYAAMFYKKCKLRINSRGGDIYEGLAIFNAIRDSKMDIEIYIDGMAASMASVIALCGRPLFMSKYARIMLHSVSAGMEGTITQLEQYINEAKTLQNTLIDIITERTGLPKDDVIKNWFDGQDHWFSASEAVEFGLISESNIYDGPVVDVPEGELTPSRLYNLFNNVLNPEEMKWTNFFKRFGLRDEATEEEAIDTVAKIEKRATDAEEENTRLKAQNAELSKKLSDKEAAEAQAQETEIKTTVENAVKDGRIQDGQKAHFTAILKADKTNGLAILNALPKGKRIMNELEQKQADMREKWTFDDWSKNDSKGLAKMKKEDNARYQALYDARYKKD